MKRTILALVMVLVFGLLGGCFVRSAAEFTPVGPYYASSGYYSYYRWHPGYYRYGSHYRYYGHHHHAGQYRHGGYYYKHHDGYYGKRSHHATIRKMKEKEKERLATVKKSSGGKKRGDHASMKRTGRTGRGHKRSR